MNRRAKEEREYQSKCMCIRYSTDWVRYVITILTFYNLSRCLHCYILEQCLGHWWLQCEEWSQECMMHWNMPRLHVMSPRNQNYTNTFQEASYFLQNDRMANTRMQGIDTYTWHSTRTHFMFVSFWLTRVENGNKLPSYVNCDEKLQKSEVKSNAH